MVLLRYKDNVVPAELQNVRYSYVPMYHAIKSLNDKDIIASVLRTELEEFTMFLGRGYTDTFMNYDNTYFVEVYDSSIPFVLMFIDDNQSLIGFTMFTPAEVSALNAQFKAELKEFKTDEIKYLQKRGLIPPDNEEETEH